MMHEVRLITENVYILGTMHISKQSSATVKASIESLSPKWVLLELDAERYAFLKKKEKGSKPQTAPKQGTALPSQVSPSTFTPTPPAQAPQESSDEFLDLLYQFQLHLGDLLNLTPGQEMLTAINIIEVLGLKFALIDRPLSHTLQRLQDLFSVDSKEHKSFQSQVDQLKHELDAQKLQKILADFQNPARIHEILAEMQSQYPQLTQILLTERNEYMAGQVIKMWHQHPHDKILVIVGAAHLDALIQIIQQKLKP